VHVFEIADSDGDLGAVRLTASNVERYQADFGYFLEPGVLLTGMSIDTEVIDDDAIVNRLQLANDRRSVFWYVESTDDPTTFDVNFAVTTNDGQELNYTVHYVVGARE